MSRRTTSRRTTSRRTTSRRIASRRIASLRVAAAALLCLSFGGLGHAFVWRFGFCLNVCPIGLYYRFVTSKAPVERSSIRKMPC